MSAAPQPRKPLTKKQRAQGETREQRQARINAKVRELRARADAKEAESDRLRAGVNDDHAFWTQPAYGNRDGGAFSASRERARNTLMRASALFFEAKELRERADAMEARGARMAGDADAEREAVIASTSITVGQTVRTLYGDRKVLKVNAKSVVVEGATGPLRIEKNLVEAL